MGDNFQITKEQFWAFEECIGDLQAHKMYSIHAAQLAGLTNFACDRVGKILGCGRYVALQPRTETAGWEIVASNFCRLRMCPMCAWRRSLRLYSHMLRVVDELQEYQWLLLTLTVPNVVGVELGDTLTELNESSRQLLKLPECRGFKGWLRCMEITYNPERKDFHPHLHFMIAVRPGYFKGKHYLSQARMQELWRLWWPSVQDTDIRKIRGCKGVAEVCKYACKPMKATEDEEELAAQAVACEALWSALHGRRLLQSAGVVRDALKRLRIDLEAEEQEGTEDAEKPLVRLAWYDSDMQYRPCRER